MKQKKKGSMLPLILVFLAGLSLLLYPAVSNFWNSRYQSNAIAGYTRAVDSGDREDHARMLEMARAYNVELLDRTDVFVEEKEWKQEYEALLNISGTGIMGYIEIPCINVRLPIYHGTEEDVLQRAIGHLEWTSLPVGGESTHSVISGHRGLPSAELLTHIDRMRLGDVFYIHVLDRVLKYCVDDIAVVLPEDTSRLRVVAGEDYMTLVTCTPYGVNSHRLLIRGTRVGDSIAVSASGQLLLADEIQTVPLIYVIPVVLLPFIILTAVGIWLGGFRKKDKTENNHEKHSETTA